MSEWKESAAKRRDARQVRGPDDARPQAAKKDKKRWCGGHVGREHEPVCMPLGKGDYCKDWRVLACKNCGKRLAAYMPFGASVTLPARYRERPKPAWVTS